MSDKEEIWVLGNECTDADKAFRWDENIPNITDADIVILDLSTLHQLQTFQWRTHAGMRQPASAANTIEQQIDHLRASVTKYLVDKLLGGGHIVYLLHYDEMLESIRDLTYMMPLGIRMEKVAERTKINQTNHRFKEYLERVQSVNYVLEIPEIPITYTLDNVRLKLKNNSLITDKLEKKIGATFDVLQDETPRGQLTFLPSILPSTSSDMIGAIVSELKGHASPPPPWVNNLKITGMNEIEDKIADLEPKKAEIEKMISELESEKRKLSSHSRLLYATGKPLEKAVKDAFVLLGFVEIAQVRKKDCEDWRIDFKSGLNADIGVIEVKGVNKKTGKRDIVQCDTWVSDYLLMNPSMVAKGILVVNQFRSDAFPGSRDKRKRFEPNELTYAETRKICIIPTFVLFEAVNKIRDGQSPDRDKMEQLIFSTNGVLESIL